MGATQRKGVDRPRAEQSDQPATASFGPVLLEPAGKKTSMRQAVAASRHEVALQLPGVTRRLAEEALSGSVNHLKLFLELSGVLKGGLGEPAKTVRERTLEEIIVEQMEQDRGPTAAEESERNRARAEEVLSGI